MAASSIHGSASAAVSRATSAVAAGEQVGDRVGRDHTEEEQRHRERARA